MDVVGPRYLGRDFAETGSNVDIWAMIAQDGVERSREQMDYGNDCGCRMDERLEQPRWLTGLELWKVPSRNFLQR